MNTGASRSNLARNNTFYQCFTIPSTYHGKTVYVTPVAGADKNREITYSEWEMDKRNAVSFVVDGEAPKLIGLDSLKEKIAAGESLSGYSICISAIDAGSGVKNLSVEIYNSDSMVRQTYQHDNGSGIDISFGQDGLMNLGVYEFTISAEDNVGNRVCETIRNSEFELKAEIEKIRETSEKAFARGESGILHISTYGYVDRVEVEFPEEMIKYDSGLNATYEYTSSPLPMREEWLRFTIPLDTPTGTSYIITVRAYKEGKQLERYPALCTIEVQGSILDELRTRLR
jgi:hypothetical protein